MTEIPSLEDYEPFQRLLLCGNTLIDVMFPILLNGTPPIRIGKGQMPIIWLSAPVSPQNDEWMELVRANVSLSPLIQVLKRSQIVRVQISNTTILHARKISQDEVVVTSLDLRPIGLAIFGDSAKGLTVGGRTLINNTIQGTRVAIALD